MILQKCPAPCLTIHTTHGLLAGMINPTLNTGALEVRNMFPTPLVIYPVPEAATLGPALETVILQKMANSPSVSKSNRHGWQSSDDIFAWAGDAGETLKQTALAIINHITRVYVPGQFDLHPFNGTWLVNGWANVNRKGASNAPHTHPGCFWSAVYYVNDGGIKATADNAAELGGQLQLGDPRGVAPLMFAPTMRIALRGCVSAGGNEIYTPRAGDLILFPSWLVHSVSEYKGDADRISIAMNFTV